ncbi:hypothetical protein BDW72DRAFT_207610 [Aspergillus terricola var. indicus]
MVPNVEKAHSASPPVATACPFPYGNMLNNGEEAQLTCPIFNGEKIMDKEDPDTACPFSTNESSPLLPTASDTPSIPSPNELLPIPSPPHQHYFGLLGHTPDLDPTLPVRTYWSLMDRYAPIFQLDLHMQYPRVFVGSRELVNEMADDTRFIKFTHRLHKEMRVVFGDGLFSAEATDKAWGKAHRLLRPAFGQFAFYHCPTTRVAQDICSQLVQRWDRFGPSHEIELIEDMSRLTFDTIGLCSFGYRFNEFYTDGPHAFQRQLKESIVESGRRANRPDIINWLWFGADEAHRQENIKSMKALCRQIIDERLANPRPEANDILNVMLTGVDKETGEKMEIENVICQILTLLGGGYETTSSTLCFIYYFLCGNPEKMRKAREEVNRIVGDRVLSYEMLRELKYLDAVMKEALRLQHPVSLLTRFAVQDTVLGGKYLIKKGQMVSGIWRHFHRDPEVWGADADQFRPERMLDMNFEKLPKNSWKPFGDGLRACIGRGFAEQEILINLAMVLQKFEVEKVNPNYELQLTGQMGVKPVDFKIRVRRRADRTLMTGIPGGMQVQQPESEKVSLDQALMAESSSDHALMPVAVFFGGNQGTCESFAETFSRIGLDLGIRAEIKELDAAVESLPTDRPCVIITPSYEGRPPDNAKRFVAWIEDLASRGHKLPARTRYTVFGVGNSDWVDTFHRIPLFINESLEKLGAERFMEAAFLNVKRELVDTFETWCEAVCSTLSGAAWREHRNPIGVEVQIGRGESGPVSGKGISGEELITGIITSNIKLADATLGPAKRHLEVRLPAGYAYQSGDYLVVQGRNSDELVARVMRRFGLQGGYTICVQSSKKTFLPTQPTLVKDFLHCKVELAAPIGKRQLDILAQSAKPDSLERAKLQAIGDEISYQRLLDMRYSVIDVLDEVPELDISFGVYLDLLLPMSPRVYSISSSPMHPANQVLEVSNSINANITFDVFEAAALSGHGTFRGVASAYLAGLALGDSIACCIRPARVPFQLPSNPETPIIMIAAGTGIAPMRAFCQERAALMRAGQEKGRFGPALLFFGCRHPENDYLYRHEFEEWEAEGIVEIVPCFSRSTDGRKGRYVQDALWEQRGQVWNLFEEGAVVYTCGSAGRLGRSAAAVWRRIWMERTGGTEAEAGEWLDGLKNVRYVSDLY